MTGASVVAEPGLRHAAVFYRTPDEYVTEVLGFVAGGLNQDEPVFVAVPSEKIDLLRDNLNGAGTRVAFADMAQMGVNPAWIIPRVQAFVDANAGRPARYVGEPIWETRTPAELTEATRHEALINLAFAGAPVSILCPYDTARLDPAVIAQAQQTHPVLTSGGSSQPSGAYVGERRLPAACDGPLPAPSAGAATLTYRQSPAAVRQFVLERALRSGLSADRAADLVIAVGELAANTLAHTDRDGTLTMWDAPAVPDMPAEVLCQVRDAGQIRDPLVGRRRPAADSGSGHGLWVVHQLCDLVELRTGSSGTVIRLHMRLAS